MANEKKRKRIRQAVSKFVELTKAGALAQYTKRPGGLSKLSTRSLQAAKGKAPLTGTNLAIKAELEKRGIRQTYQDIGVSPLKYRKKKRG